MSASTFVACAGEENNDIEKIVGKSLPDGLKAEMMPKHVAMILDGNRRWAKERGIAAQFRPQVLRSKLKELAIFSTEFGVKLLTVFVFSTENWNRSKEEVDFLMRLFEDMLTADLEDYNRNGTRITIIGEKSRLPEPLRNAITIAEDTTKDNTKLHLMMAMNYGGRQDIIQATKRIARKVNDGMMTVENIDEKLFSDELLTNCTKFPSPDLLIRTSGEQRLSNFLMWQLAYSELYFAVKKFPEFEKEDFIEALKSFQGRQRRYGGE